MSASGCDDVAGTWMTSCRRPLLGFVLPYVNGDVEEAEDVVQETMLRGWQHETDLRLAPIPGLLAGVPREMAGGRPAAANGHRVAVLSPVAVVAPKSAAPTRVSGRRRRAAASAALAATSWGTSIRLRIRGVPENVRCSLVVRPRSGATEAAGTWTPWRAGPISVPASAAWRLSDIASLQVRAGTGTLVTIRADRGLTRSGTGSATPRRAP